jgi:hypothetical protein
MYGFYLGPQGFGPQGSQAARMREGGSEDVHATVHAMETQHYLDVFIRANISLNPSLHIHSLRKHSLRNTQTTHKGVEGMAAAAAGVARAGNMGGGGSAQQGRNGSCVADWSRDDPSCRSDEYDEEPICAAVHDNICVKVRRFLPYSKLLGSGVTGL